MWRLLLLGIVPFSLFASKMSNDIDILKNSFEVKYAPAHLKEKLFGWSLSNEVVKAKLRVNVKDSVSTKEFQQTIREFFYSTRDYHTRVFFHSTEAALLPFRVQKIEGKYIVTWVYKDLAKALQYYAKEDIELLSGLKLQPGDQVVEFAGKPVDQVILDLKKKYLGNDDSETSQRLAESLLTMRLGSLGEDVPKGHLTISFKRNGKTSNYLAKWLYQEEEIASNVILANDSLDPLAENPLLNKKRCAALYDHMDVSIFKDQDSGKLLGNRRSFLPPLGKIVWEWSDPSFDSYMYESPGGHLVGFVRIPHFNGDSHYAGDFEKIIAYLKKKTDALVIDQMNNPGGSLFYLYALLSHLSEKPLRAPKESATITQEDVSLALDLYASLEGLSTDSEVRGTFGDTVEGYRVTAELAGSLRHFCNYIVKEWEKGKAMTSPYPLFGIENIEPHPFTRYKKPILVLVNSLDFSCADLFPAILQDNNRAVIFGTKTAGAGGYVNSYSYPNRFGIDYYTLTGSVTQRRDGSHLENTGVNPDVSYEMSATDCKSNYREMVEAINVQVEKMIIK